MYFNNHNEGVETAAYHNYLFCCMCCCQVYRVSSVICVVFVAQMPTDA